MHSDAPFTHRLLELFALVLRDWSSFPFFLCCMCLAVGSGCWLEKRKDMVLLCVVLRLSSCDSLRLPVLPACFLLAAASHWRSVSSLGCPCVTHFDCLCCHCVSCWLQPRVGVQFFFSGSCVHSVVLVCVLFIEHWCSLRRRLEEIVFFVGVIFCSSLQVLRRYITTPTPCSRPLAMTTNKLDYTSRPTHLTWSSTRHWASSDYL